MTAYVLDTNIIALFLRRNPSVETTLRVGKRVSWMSDGSVRGSTWIIGKRR
jgi:hypothetical protein